MDHFRLLIIGAGASGIAAAARLIENNFKDFRILEAENRIGGRVFTTSLDGTSVELGAEWIHGEIGNIVFELASTCDLADNSPPKIDFKKTNFFDFSGNQINNELSKAMFSAYYEIFKAAKKEFSGDQLNDSLGRYFENELEKCIPEIRKTVSIDDELFKKFINSLEIWQNCIDGSHSWYETSLRGDLEYWECEGNGLTSWKNNSYSTIFNLLTKNNSLNVNEKVLLNKEVIKVKWNKDMLPYIPTVVVECQDGTIYHADNLLITCSLGVLKERNSMFTPSLPKQKINCIQNLGFGTVDKIFIKFKDCWWGDDFHGCGFLWSEEEKDNDSSNWLSGVFGFHPLSPTLPILRGWITGQAAKQMENLFEDELLNGLNYLLDKFLGSTFEVPLIEKCLVSNWYNNPNFRGSYSCRYLQSEREDVWASGLAETVCNNKGKPILFFGGEASHDHYYSTVHGAIEAGYREADKFLQHCSEPVEDDVDPEAEYCTVAIVGAGISGVAAAKTLSEKGVSDIIILEAQSEPGGRIRSFQVDDYFVELGAQWVHGTKNEIFNISKAYDLLTDESSPEGQGKFLRENSTQIDEGIIREVEYVVNEILENCEGYVHMKKYPRSVGDELFEKFDEYLSSCTEDSTETIQIKKELLNWHVKFNLIDNACSDLRNLSAKAWGLFKFCGGNEYVNFKNGYSSLINSLIENLPENKIRCNTAVKQIHWAKELYEKKSGEKLYKTKIITQDGGVIHSQYVIVTSSLGYLKKNYKSMFLPPLPRYLSKAIESLGFGVLNKIFLIYKQPWWNSEDKGFQLVWAEEDYDSWKSDWAKYITGFDVVLKDKPVLLGWVAGNGAAMVEEISEEDIGLKTTEILRQFTNNEEIPLPEKVIRTKWSANEFVRGAYSHVSVRCDKESISCSNLARPVFSVLYSHNNFFTKPTILLAGEAAHENYFSTVHGAYESGQSQAQVILNDLQS